MKVAIIDYDTGNLGSIANLCENLGYSACITSSPLEISNSDKVILPGVGSFDFGISSLHRLNLVKSLQEHAIEKKKPFLGICLGMQLITKSSEEGTLDGLGWIPAITKKMTPKDLRIPHMGWRKIQAQPWSKLLRDTPIDNRFYFAHSFCVKCEDESISSSTTEYDEKFTCSVEQDNIFATQFHPEKSQKNGINLFEKFLSMT